MGGSIPDIPGTRAEPELANSFRYEVANLIGWKGSTKFPGAQPVSFASKHLLELQKEDYYVCEKTDGIRCLMYLTQDGEDEVVYMIDRKNDYYHVPGLHFPRDAENPAQFHTQTLLDGELVNDRQPDGSLKMQFLVFDCLIMDGNNLMRRSLDKRLAYFREKLLFPYDQLYKKYPQELDYVPFTVGFKHVELGYAIEKLFDTVIPKLKHGSDGLIFTCRSSPYTPGTDEKILKWKLESENSIDFRMWLQSPMVDPDSDEEDGAYPDYTAVPQVQLTVFGGSEGDLPFATMALTASEWEGLKARGEPLNERVVECCIDKSGNWRYSRFRDDKPESNHISTAEKVMESIQDGVTKQELINHQGRIKEAWKRRQAVIDEQSRKNQESRKSAPVTPQQRGGSAQNGDPVNLAGGVKRKFESDHANPG